VIRLAEHLGCPVLVAPKAKGIMPEDHQLFSGVIEMLGHDVPVSLIRKADLLLAIGFDPVELDKPWLFDAPVVHIDQVPNTDGYYAASCEVVGDVRSALRALVGSLLPRGSWQWALEDIRASRHELLGLVTRKVSGLAGHDVVRTARQMLPADAIATCDVGAHKFMVGQLWTTYTPRTFFMSNGLSSMGYGFPTALTAKLLFPETPVIGFLGDGGMSMYLGEIETAVRLGVPLITVVLCDESLSLIKMNQERKGIPYTGVEFGNPDYAEIARCFGASGFRVQSQSEMQQALAEAMTSQKPVFIHADIDASAYRI